MTSVNSIQSCCHWFEQHGQNRINFNWIWSIYGCFQLVLAYWAVCETWKYIYIFLVDVKRVLRGPWDKIQVCLLVRIFEFCGIDQYSFDWLIMPFYQMIVSPYILPSWRHWYLLECNHDVWELNVFIHHHSASQSMGCHQNDLIWLERDNIFINCDLWNWWHLIASSVCLCPSNHFKVCSLDSLEWWSCCGFCFHACWLIGCIWSTSWGYSQGNSWWIWSRKLFDVNWEPSHNVTKRQQKKSSYQWRVFW